SLRPALPHDQRAGRSGNPRLSAALHQLADVPAVLSRRRADRRLRHRGRTAPAGRTAGHGRRRTEGGVMLNTSELVPAADTLAGRVVLVTGANGGLGEAVVRACAGAGAQV